MLRPARACWSAHAVGIAGLRLGSRASAPDECSLPRPHACPRAPERGMCERYLACLVAGHTISPARPCGSISTTALAARALAESVRRAAR